MALLQLDFFEDTDISLMKAEIKKIAASQDRCRKKQFADIGEIKKQVYDLIVRLEIIERNICK